jgi:hypothetical protein
MLGCYELVGGECVWHWGHWVPVTGVNRGEQKIALSDPWRDYGNTSGNDHNDAQFVSHDILDVELGSPCSQIPGIKCWLTNTNYHDLVTLEFGIVFNSTFPDIECDGNLIWENVSKGDTCHGSFSIENMGGNGTLLDWKIKSYPEWGEWTFDPDKGNDLETGVPLTINVTVIVPKHSDEGHILLQNKEHSEDYCIIDAKVTPKAKSYNLNLMVQQFFSRYKSIHNLCRI